MNDLLDRCAERPASSAVISPCGLYRLRLDRALANPSGPVITLGMVNPSTADASENDATIRRGIGFGNRLGGSRLIVWNKCALRSKDIKALRTAHGPVGADNDAHIEAILREGDIHIVAWGALAKLPPHLRNRWREVVAIADRVGAVLHCFGVGADGHPKHPLYLPADAPLVRWSSHPSASGARQEGV